MACVAKLNDSLRGQIIGKESYGQLRMIML